MIIRHLNPVLPVRSLISLSKSARIFIPDRAVPLVYHLFCLFFLLARRIFREPAGRTCQAQRALALSMEGRVIVVETLLNFSCSGTFPSFVTVPKGGKMRYKLTTFHQYLIDQSTVGSGFSSSSGQTAHILWILLIFSKFLCHKRTQAMNICCFSHPVVWTHLQFSLFKPK